MTYLGDINLGDTFDCKFCTVSTTGAPTTLAGTPVISAYPGNSITQLTAGITLTVDFDAVTGMHNVRVVATSGNGYATATNYALVITTGTVGGTSVVGYVIGHFSIEARSALRPTVAARTLDVSSTGEAGVDWANVGSPTTSLSLSGTTVATVTTTTTATNVTTVNGLAANVITATAIADNAIDRATFAADTGLQTIRSNTAQAGAASTITLDVSANATNDFYADAWVLITGGTGVGQARLVVSYVGATKVATIAPNWATNPDNTSTFAILPAARADLALWLGVAPNALVSNRVDTTVGAMQTDVLTSGALAASAVTEIQTGLATSSALATVQADTDDIQTRLPTALVSGRMDASVGAYQTGLAPLQPTTAGRTLDVSVGGEAGIDWANVGTPGSTVALSATTVATATNLTTNNDKTGYALSGAGVTAVQTGLATPTNITAGTITTATNVTTVNGLAANVITAASMAADASAEIADAILTRDWTAVSGIASRSVLNALRAIRNRVAVAAGVMTVYQEDDATSAWTAAVTTDASADPVTQIDPT